MNSGSAVLEGDGMSLRGISTRQFLIGYTVGIFKQKCSNKPSKFGVSPVVFRRHRNFIQFIYIFKNSIHCDRPRETAMEETSIYVCGSESPCEYTQRVSFPKSRQNLNKQAAEKGFVGEPGRQRKKTLAGSFSNGQGGKILDGKTELRLVATIPIRLPFLLSSPLLSTCGQSHRRGETIFLHSVRLPSMSVAISAIPERVGKLLVK